MSRSDLIKRKISSISLRTAFPSALIISLIGFLLLYFFYSIRLSQSVGFALALFASSFVIIYLVSARLHNERVRTLYKIVKNISRKKFKDYDNYPEELRDELDHLIERSIRASDTVSKELARLNKIENYRKEFIGDISHELKTPIFAIQGFIETLLNGAIHDKNVNEVFLKKTMRNVNRLIYLTNDLMEISRLETGELKSNIKEMYLRDVVLDVVESLQYKAQKENIEIRVKDFDKNIQVRADRNQVKQVLINLIENGMKYNKPGGYVEIGVTDYKKSKDKLLLYVHDTGIGIEKKDLKRVTERFFRVDKSRSREKGGTGLGLAIVKHIVEAHGEKLFIESSPEEGSTFSITLTRTNPVLV
ncbi:MAG: ATP-binding protein [Balneolaceae bacterium]|nr:ATP-binding protein [Balneolaceae bacterium]